MPIGKIILNGVKYDSIIDGRRYSPYYEPNIEFVNYIESSGGQYIDTGFKPGSETRIICDFQFTKTSLQFLFCARNGASQSFSNRYGLLLTLDDCFRSDYKSESLPFPSTIKLTDRHTVDFNKEVCTIDGVVVTHEKSSFQSVYNLFLLAGNTGGSVGYNANAKLYSCMVYENNILVKNYKPCKDKNGYYCLYDIVSKEYVYNSGTGEFTGG